MHAAALLVATLGFVLTSSPIAAADSIVTSSTNAFTFAVSANNDLDVWWVVVHAHNA